MIQILQSDTSAALSRLSSAVEKIDRQLSWLHSADGFDEENSKRSVDGFEAWLRELPRHPKYGKTKIGDAVREILEQEKTVNSVLVEIEQASTQLFNESSRMASAILASAREAASKALKPHFSSKNLPAAIELSEVVLAARSMLAQSDLFTAQGWVISIPIPGCVRISASETGLARVPRAIEGLRKLQKHLRSECGARGIELAP